MSAEQLVESFCRLVTKLDFNSENAQSCKELKRKYRPIIASNNTKKKESIATLIRESITPLYKTYREEILSKDFSFITEAKKDNEGRPIPGDDALVIDGHDIGVMYIHALDDDDDKNLHVVVNELLFLFYQIAPEEDQKLINAKYKKQPKPSAPITNPVAASQSAQPGLAKKMEEMLKKNKNKLKKAEQDPNAIPEVLADFFQNNSKDMAGMLTGMLGSMGIDPSQMNNGK